MEQIYNKKMKNIGIYFLVFVFILINEVNAQVKLATIDTNQIVSKSIAHIEATKIFEKFTCIY